MRNIILYNCLENFLLFAMLLNSVIYPSVSSAFYFLSAMGLTAISMNKDEKKVKLKFDLSIALLVISAGIMITKGVFLIMLNNEGVLSLSKDERLLYDSLGIRID